MIEFESSSDACAIHSGGFRLAFFRRNERWVHRIESGLPLRWSPCAESIEQEFTIATDIVRSPIYQELHVEGTKEQARVLLLGGLSRHHFSAAFQVIERDYDIKKAVYVMIDVAVRSASDLKVLSASYKLARAPDIPRTEGEIAPEIRWNSQGKRSELTFRASDAPGVQSFTRWSTEAGELLAEIRTSALVPAPGTSRLAYGWSYLEDQFSYSA
jgi:hypothetical protein